MKKVILATLMAGLIPMLASAQGTVSFQTSTANHKITLDGNPVPAGFSVGLYWGALGSTESQLIQLGAATTVNTITGFLVNGGTRTTGNATAGGQSGTFQIRAWNGGAAAWADNGNPADQNLWPVGATHLGRSALFTNPTGDPLASPPGTAAQLTGWTAPVAVTPIPEPSTIALAGLGVASLLALRRRK